MMASTETALRERIEYLEAEVANLRDELGVVQTNEQIAAARRCFRIMPQQAKLLLALMSGRQRSYDALRSILWGDVDDSPETNALKVHIALLRKGLIPHGIGFNTIWGFGLQMGAQDCAKVRATLEGYRVAA